VSHLETPLALFIFSGLGKHDFSPKIAAMPLTLTAF
jgi:hypothetical protein